MHTFFNGGGLNPPPPLQPPPLAVVATPSGYATGITLFPQTDTSSSYLAVDSTHAAVGRFRSLVRRSGIRCLTNSEIWRVVLTV